MKCWCVHAPGGGGAMATPLSSRFAPTTTTLRVPLQHLSHCALKLLSPPRAASSGEDTASADQEQPPAPTAATKTATADDDFEERVLRIKSRVRPKKRGARKKKAGAAASASAVTLPPVPLREAKSRLGAPVEFGFTAYSERLNGALAAVGLRAAARGAGLRAGPGEVPPARHAVPADLHRRRGRRAVRQVREGADQQVAGTVGCQAAGER